MLDIEKYLNSPEFTDDQKKEIELGAKEGLDVSIYAKPEFLAIQMFQIRIGLEKGIPVKWYAREEYDWFQMKEIRKGLERNLDVRKYAFPSIRFDVMREIRKGLEAGIDLSACRNFNAGVLREFRIAACEKLDIIKYVKQGYDEEQLKEIRVALEKDIDIDPYISLWQRGAFIREIALGIEKHMDIASYTKDQRINWQQLREIRLGLEERLDVTLYQNPLYSWQQMREIRLGLEENLPVEEYKSFMYTAKEMQKRRLHLLEEREKDSSEKESEQKGYDDFTLITSANRMEATLMVLEKGIKIDSRRLHKALKENHIVAGIDEQLIKELETDGAGEEMLTIARGKESARGTDGWYEYFFDTDIKATPKLLDNGAVDYRNMKWFEIVHKDQPVACYHPASQGVTGYRVDGEILPGKKGAEQPPLRGKGFNLLPDQVTYVAAMDGKVDLVDGRLEITSVLILQDVTRASGNADFNGSVYVRGMIGEGVEIKAKGDILVDGFTESAVLEAGRNILLREGCNTGGKGYIKAGNDVMGKFFENTSVIAGNDVKTNYCMNSDITAGHNVEIAGTKGRITGGSVNAGECITSDEIGNAAGIMTMISVGNIMDYRQNRMKLEQLKKDVIKELQLLKNAYDTFHQKYPPEIRNANPMYLKIESAISAKAKELKSIDESQQKLEQEEDNLSKAKVVVSGMLYQNVTINIGGALFYSKPVSNVTLKRKDGTIVLYRGR